MEVIKSPNPLREGFSVFLAGSIEEGAAEDWQARVEEGLSESDILIFNPRRDNWDSSWVQSRDNPQFRKQVEWELSAQEQADVIVMYFDPSTKSPITLLELGLFGRAGKMIVCCPDGFWRKGNVDIVCDRYHIDQVDSLDELINSIISLIPDGRDDGSETIKASIIQHVVAWVWDAVSRRYRGGAGTDFAGQYIGPEKMTELRDVFVNSQTRQMDRLADRLASNEITLQEWQSEFRQVLKQTYTDSYFAAKGGRQRATPQDWGRLGKMLREQYLFQERFARDIAAGKLSVGQIKLRSSMYISSAVAAFERGKAAAWGIKLKKYPGSGDTPCLVACRCSLEIRENGPNVEVFWRLDLDPNVEHCSGCIEMAGLWNPLVINKASID